MSNHTVGVNRDAAIKRVMMSIAAGHPRQVKLLYVADDGSQPLVVTTPNEYLSEVIARVQAAGGAANVALAEARKFTVFVIHNHDDEASEGNSDEDANVDMSMGMFLIRARANKRRGGQGWFRITDGASSDVAFQEFAYSR